MTSSVRDQTKFSKAWIVFGALILILLCAVLLPIAWPNGTERYSDLKKSAAQEAIQFFYDQSVGINGVGMMGTFGLSVENVQVDQPSYADAQTFCNSTFKDGSNASAPDRYLVTLKRHSFFNIETGKETYHICRTK